jgi:23S rRNA (uracil1939-C5)-methyltransferase
MALITDSNVAPSGDQSWQQGALVEVMIADLSDSGDGVGRVGQRVVFVPDTVTGDRALVRLVRVKPQYAHGKLHDLLEASPHRIRPRCIVADKCGGCQWQQVSYSHQLEIKRNIVIQALQRIGGFENPLVEAVLSGSDLGYRNKATYPIQRAEGRGQRIEARQAQADGAETQGWRADSRGRRILRRERSADPPIKRGQRTDEFEEAAAQANLSVIAGYYQKGSHQIVNLNQCPIQDERLNPLLAEVKQDIQKCGWGIYDETKHRGKLRHLALRIGRRTGEMLLTLVVKEANLAGLETQAQEWLERYPGLVGVLVNVNGDRTNTIFGPETHCIAGQPHLHETFAGLTFQISPDTFFQVNTEQAEALLDMVSRELALQGDEILVDAYCGIGTMTLPLAKQARQVIAIEIQPEAIAQAIQNAALNHLDNITFHTGSVEQVLPAIGLQPSIVLLDPPRKGCDPVVLETLIALNPERIVYMSCNPATLARDLKILCSNGAYQLTKVQPADFFPQTPHVECTAFLQRSDLTRSTPINTLAEG